MSSRAEPIHKATVGEGCLHRGKEVAGFNNSISQLLLFSLIQDSNNIFGFIYCMFALDIEVIYRNTEYFS